MEKETDIDINDETAMGMHKRIPAWNEIVVKLPQDLDSGKEKVLKGYYRMQKRIALGRLERAKELGNLLDKISCFEEFEKNNSRLFATIDIAVRGETNRRDSDDKPLEPLFRLE